MKVKSCRSRVAVPLSAILRKRLGISPKSTAPLVRLTPTLLPVERKSVGSGLSLQSLIRPDEALRASIEAFLLDQRSEHTRTAYRKDLKRFVSFLLLCREHDTFQSLSRAVIIQYRESLRQEGLMDTTVDRHLATLRSFFDWLVEDGHFERNPATGVRFLSPKRISSTLAFTDKEVQRVLMQPNLHSRVGALHYAILMLLFYGGLRRSELCELRTEHLFHERGQPVLRLRGKGNRERLIVLTPSVWHACLHYFRISRRKLDEPGPLFVAARKSHTLRALNPSTIYYIVVKYAKQAGIRSRVSPHSCRATAISNARDHKVPDRAIQEFAGWTTPVMIMHYDKRRTAIEDSAAFMIHYGDSGRVVPNSVVSEDEASV
jgi:integrase/recombinase XerD